MCLILYVTMMIMRYFTIILFLFVFSPSAAMSGPKEGWFFGLLPPAEWPDNHWKGQSYNPSILNDTNVVKPGANRKKSLFYDIEGLKPADFVDNLKQANIIESTYNRKVGSFWNKKTTDDIIIELDHNFYALSHTDQSVIAELLSKSYERPFYLLKDASTHDIVGHINESKLYLF